MTRAAALLTVALTQTACAGVGDLPRKLSTADAPNGVDPVIGDITYYAPWGNLAIFYRDFGYSTGLIKLGSINSGIEALARLSGDVTVTVQRANAASR